MKYTTRYIIEVPIRLHKERLFLSRLDKNNVPYDESEIYGAAEGVAITITCDTLSSIEMDIEQYIKTLKIHTRGILME